MYDRDDLCYCNTLVSAPQHLHSATRGGRFITQLDPEITFTSPQYWWTRTEPEGNIEVTCESMIILFTYRKPEPGSRMHANLSLLWKALTCYMIVSREHA